VARNEPFQANGTLRYRKHHCPVIRVVVGTDSGGFRLKSTSRFRLQSRTATEWCARCQVRVVVKALCKHCTIAGYTSRLVRSSLQTDKPPHLPVSQGSARLSCSELRSGLINFNDVDGYPRRLVVKGQFRTIEAQGVEEVPARDGLGERRVGHALGLYRREPNVDGAVRVFRQLKKADSGDRTRFDACFGLREN
jgi:hypothetical protein